MLLSKDAKGFVGWMLYAAVLLRFYVKWLFGPIVRKVVWSLSKTIGVY